ncbi:hypothetical protein JHK84_033264 [Glycine max]|nr:hypothetical protein JHK85_033635 [Glycine max]KAG4985328.1 hypothetical protein JHK86_033019 [Glycine max]KAG5139496.1 hypothetical protein JHK84_033264 [Glycine max]
MFAAGSISLAPALAAASTITLSPCSLRCNPFKGLRPTTYSSSPASSKLAATSLIVMYSKCEKVEDARKGAANEALGLVETMKLMGLKPNVKFRNKEAFDTFKQMLSHGCCPTSATISTLLPACATAARVRRGICLVGCQRRTPYVTWNSIIFGFVNHGYCEEAIELFNQMEKERAAKLDHLTFTAALTACSHVGDIELGQKLFKIMQEKYSIEPPLEH